MKKVEKNQLFTGLRTTSFIILQCCSEFAMQSTVNTGSFYLGISLFLYLELLLFVSKKQIGICLLVLLLTLVGQVELYLLIFLLSLLYGNKIYKVCNLTLDISYFHAAHSWANDLNLHEGTGNS